MSSKYSILHEMPNVPSNIHQISIQYHTFHPARVLASHFPPGEGAGIALSPKIHRTSIDNTSKIQWALHQTSIIYCIFTQSIENLSKNDRTLIENLSKVPGLVQNGCIYMPGGQRPRRYMPCSRIHALFTQHANNSSLPLFSYTVRSGGRRLQEPSFHHHRHTTIMFSGMQPHISTRS